MRGTVQTCREVDLPWGLIIALKSKIRSYNVQSDDTWSMQAFNGPRAEVSFARAAAYPGGRNVLTGKRREGLVSAVSTPIEESNGSCFSIFRDFCTLGIQSGNKEKRLFEASSGRETIYRRRDRHTASTRRGLE